MMNELKESQLSANNLQLLAKDILQQAQQNGATQAAVNISTNKGFSVQVREGDVETVEYNQDKLIEINVLYDKRSGSAGITDLRPEAVRAGVEAACHIAKFTGEDPCAGLAEKAELSNDYPALKLYFPWTISVEEAIQLACECEREAKAYDKRIMSADGVSVGTLEGFHLYANSNGFIGHFPYTRHEINCVLIGKLDDEMQRDYSYTISADPAKLSSISHVAKEAAKNTVDRLGARSIKTTKAPVIYIAEEARGLLGHFTAAIAGGSLYRKSSFLLNQLEKQVFPDFVNIQEFPHLNQSLGSSPFDDDGVITRNNVFIENGFLKSYALGVYSARKLGMKTTGNSGGIHNLTITPGNKNLSELLKTMGRGLLVTEIMGQGVNILTGDYSRGVAGFWVENGEIQYPVSEVTVAGNLKDIFRHISEVGTDVDRRGNVHTGSILIDEMMIAGS